jgi:hypothetical protein
MATPNRNYKIYVFPCIWSNNLKTFIGHKIITFHLKYLFCCPFFRPLGSAARRGPHKSPPAATLLVKTAAAAAAAAVVGGGCLFSDFDSN